MSAGPWNQGTGCATPTAIRGWRTGSQHAGQAFPTLKALWCAHAFVPGTMYILQDRGSSYVSNPSKLDDTCSLTPGTVRRYHRVHHGKKKVAHPRNPNAKMTPSMESKPVKSCSADHGALVRGEVVVLAHQRVASGPSTPTRKLARSLPCA